MSNITFPITVNPATAHQSGIYVAQQFQTSRAPSLHRPPAPENSGGRERLSARSPRAPTARHVVALPRGRRRRPRRDLRVDFAAVCVSVRHQVERSGTDTWKGTARVSVARVRSVHLGSLAAASGSGKLRARRAASPGATPGSRAARRCPGPTPCSAARPPDGRGRSERHLQGQLRVQRLCRHVQLPGGERRHGHARDPGLRLVTPARRGRRRASAEAGPAPSWERRPPTPHPHAAAALPVAQGRLADLAFERGAEGALEV